MTVDRDRASQEILGYLNFSSGSSEPKFLANLNWLFAAWEGESPLHGATWRRVFEVLNAALDELRRTAPAFSDAWQAQQVLSLTHDFVLPAYREFHRDLLFHQSDDFLFQPLFLGRVFECVLRQGAPWDETNRIVEATIQCLNDYVGYRPVAVLHSTAKIESYAHERVRPIPLYIAEVGAGVGQYAELVGQAVAILRETDSAILRAAQLDPDLLLEIALDPRAYDFDHPVNKRPNYQFGLWDPLQIDQRGNYHRFVLQQFTVDAVYQRIASESGERRAEYLLEGASVLAGVMLMASGISGGGPEAYDSSLTLGKLVPRIAEYRDRFYEQRLTRIAGEHGERLKTEAKQLRQPFGGARQYLNYQLARQRAEQLQCVHMALLYARMGYAEAATRQANQVSVASGRLQCDINSRITTANNLIDRGEIEAAIDGCQEIESLLHRGIECGAIIDPWNILGFQANFSIFPALENSVHDHRADDLVDLMRRVFSLLSRLECQAALRGDERLRQASSLHLKKLATWWDRFATVEVSGIEHISGVDSWESANHVAGALAAAHQAGDEARKLSFWRDQLAGFRSPKAYALVVSALIDQQDWAAALALLMQWLSEHDTIDLEHAEFSFHEQAFRWMSESLAAARRDSQSIGIDDQLRLIRRFFDHAEANAEGYWQAPRVESVARPMPSNEQADDEDEGLFGAAYESMVYRDSTADGHEGETLESGPAPTDLEQEHESQRLTQHLAFLVTIARLWRYTAVALGAARQSVDIRTEFAEAVSNWLAQSRRDAAGLCEFLRAIHSRPLPRPGGSRESLLDFDRRRMSQQALLERGIAAAASMNDAIRHLAALAPTEERSGPQAEWNETAVKLYRAIFTGGKQEVRTRLVALKEQIAGQPLLYRPIATGGDPWEVVKSQNLQHLFADLVVMLPRLGLLGETCELLALAQAMELSNSIGRGAVSEFDRLFRVGFKSLVQSIVESAEQWRSLCPGENEEKSQDAQLIECLEPLTEKLLQQWLMHSRSLRLSVLEKLTDQHQWEILVGFIERYGSDLFTQSFFHLGNLRAILHQGVDSWLTCLLNDADEASHFRLLEDLDRGISRAEAVGHLEMVLEAVLEHYPEYKDYNSIATQSDRGELIHVLLDFLRLKVRYERVVWNLKPVFLAHEVLIRGKRLHAAELWQQTFRAKTHEAADWHERRLKELTEKYGLRLPSINDRLAERFVRPLTLDRIRALLKPAMEESRSGNPPYSFGVVEQEVARFAEEPSGAGLDVPAWLQVLEREVEELERRHPKTYDQMSSLPLFSLTYEEVINQLDDWQPDKQ